MSGAQNRFAVRVGGLLQLPRLITVSNCITREATKGHPYWWHKTLEMAASGMAIKLINCGPRDQECDRIRGVLSHPGRLRNKSSVFGTWDLDSDVRAAQRILNEDSSKTVVHIYEGGFREFLFARKILKTNPDVTLLFNFNYTDPWHLLLEKRTLSSFLARKLLNYELRRMHPRLVPLAETFETSARFSKGFKSDFYEYPLFSILQTSSQARENKKRTYDATFFPADNIEMSRVLESIANIKSRSETFKALIVPRWGLQLKSSEIKDLEKKGIGYAGGVLDSEDYGALYASSKLAVFPYESSYYLNTSSGRLLDAASAGCYCIAPEKSLPGRQITREGWGSTYTEMIHEIEFGIQSWGDFAPGNVPSAENALHRLLNLAINSNLKAYKNPWKSIYLPDWLVFSCVLFGTGVRSWGPRLFFALRAMRQTSE